LHVLLLEAECYHPGLFAGERHRRRRRLSSSNAARGGQSGPVPNVDYENDAVFGGHSKEDAVDVRLAPVQELADHLPATAFGSRGASTGRLAECLDSALNPSDSPAPMERNKSLKSRSARSVSSTRYVMRFADFIEDFARGARSAS
jgi:hypothetical protein